MQLSLFNEQVQCIEGSLDYALKLFDDNLKAGRVRVSTVYDFEKLAKLKIELAKHKSQTQETVGDKILKISFV